MKIHGRECKFRLTIGASVEIAELCPEGDIKNIGDLLSGRYAETLGATAKIIVALNKGYEDAQKYEQEGYVARPLSVEEVLTLDGETLAALQAEALAAFTNDQKTSVEDAPAKKKTKAKEASS